MLLRTLDGGLNLPEEVVAARNRFAVAASAAGGALETRRIAPTQPQMYPRALSDKDLASISQPFDVGGDNDLECITAPLSN